MKVSGRVLLSLFAGAWAHLALAQSPVLPGPGLPVVSTGHPMVTPIMSDSGSNVPSATALNYGPLGGGTWSTSTVAREVPVGINGTLSGLQVRFPTATGAGATYNICLVKNGSSTCTALACQIANSALTCNDTIDTVSVSAGDLVAWQVCPSNASGCPAGSVPAAQSGVQISAILTSTADGESAIFATNTTQASASAQNFDPWGSNSAWQTTDAIAASVMPTNGVIDQFYFYDNTAPGASKSYQAQIYHNGSASAITCTVTGTGSGAGITTCNDLTHSITITAGDTFSLSVTPTGNPATGTMFASVRWVPTIPGEAVGLSVSSSAPSVTNLRFQAVSGGATTTTTESLSLALAPSAFTIKKYYFTVDVAPGGSASRVSVLRSGTGSGQSNAGTPSAVGCTLTTTAQCQDATDTFLTSVGTLIDWSETPNSTPAEAAYLKLSSVLYTP